MIKKSLKTDAKKNRSVVKTAEKWYSREANLLLLLTGITILVYIPVMKLGFTMLDDSIFIVENQFYNSDLSNLYQSFRRGLFNPENDFYYRPVFLVDFILESRLFGVNAAGYHFSNLLYHVVCVILLFRFFKAVGIRQSVSFWLSLIFALHPVLCQAVAWIPGRNDMLLMIFFLSGFLLSLKYARQGSWHTLLLQGVAFMLALFTKETAVIIPVVILFVIIFSEKAPWKRWGPLVIVWSVEIIAWLVTRSHATLMKRNFTIWELIQNGFERIPALIQYLGKIFFPFNLSVFPAIEHNTVWWGVLALALLTWLIILSKSYFKLLTILGVIWFVLFLMPVLVVPPSLNDQVFEHRLYLPIVGILLILSQTRLFNGIFSETTSEKNVSLATTRQNAVKRYFKPAIAGFILLAYTTITFVRIEHFKDPVTFWGYAVRDNPTSSYASMMLGLRQTDKTEMKRYLFNAYRLNPQEKMLNYLLGRLEVEAGNFKEAEYYLKREIAISQIPDNYFNLALVYFNKSNFDSAAWCLERVIELSPLHPQANHNLSLLYMQLNRKADAAKLIETMKQKGLDVPAELKNLPQ
jgi:hypothetical protein